MTEADGLVERVARAMAFDDGEDYYEDPKFFERYARAALKAIEEATPKMIHQGAAAFDHPSVFMGGPSAQGRKTAERIWQAMVKAATDA